MGGTAVDNESIKNNDFFHMQQTIIFLKAELAKYKNEVTKHRESDYYSLVVKLEEENEYLMNKNKELSTVLLELKKDFEKETKDYNEVMHSQEVQRLKQISSIEALLKDKNDLRTMNQQLAEALKAAQDELTAYKRERYEIREADYKVSIEKLEHKLSDFIQEISTQMYAIVENFERTHKEISESDNIKVHLVKEIEEKSDEIEKLLNELSTLKQQSEDSSSPNSKSAKNTHMLAYLDVQVKKVLEQSIDFEEQLDAKIRILNDLDQKLNQLTIDIDGP